MAKTKPVITAAVSPLLTELEARAVTWLDSSASTPYGTSESEAVLDAQHHNDAYEIIASLLAAVRVVGAPQEPHE